MTCLERLIVKANVYYLLIYLYKNLANPVRFFIGRCNDVVLVTRYDYVTVMD